MTMTKGLLSVLLIVFSASVSAAERYVDPIQKKIDEQHQPLIVKYKKTCQAKSTVGCRLEAAGRASETIPNRGSPKYCRQTYSGYTKAQGKTTLGELVKLYDALEDQTKVTNWPGKITQGQIDFEASCLLDKVGERRDGVIGARLYLGLPVH